MPSVKRVFDIGVSGLAIVILAPVIVAAALIVRIGIGRPVVFSQLRPGRKGEIFRMFKFRSMSDARGPDGAILPDHERLTSLGRFLRATSLDELPGLWNVLQGDMSLVGPRPLLVEYLPLYTPEQMRRHDVAPGLTGLAQVSGRNSLSWEEKFRLDCWYVDNRSFWLDLKILVQTALKVLRRSGIAAPGEATMPRFVGSKPDAVDGPTSR